MHTSYDMGRGEAEGGSEKVTLNDFLYLKNFIRHQMTLYGLKKSDSKNGLNIVKIFTIFSIF